MIHLDQIVKKCQDEKRHGKEGVGQSDTFKAYVKSPLQKGFLQTLVHAP